MHAYDVRSRIYVYTFVFVFVCCVIGTDVSCAGGGYNAASRVWRRLNAAPDSGQWLNAARCMHRSMSGRGACQTHDCWRGASRLVTHILTPNRNSEDRSIVFASLVGDVETTLALSVCAL